MRKRSGFTLIELIAVVAIMGMLVALAALRLEYLIPKYRLRGAAREVATVLKLAKSRAAADGKDVFVQVDLPEGKYWILAEFPVLDDDGRPKEGEFELQRVFQRGLPDGVQFVDLVMGKDRKIDAGRAIVRMSPFGSSPHVIVNLRGDGEVPFALRLNGLTGVITFHEEYKDADDLLEDVGD